ncbi:hypothetical protein U8335_07470 [Roseiconus lacunae]|uniref:hypothetical protein n=1 Tax=Roseiconus lacunae TaxID=2605694 RepID=UPI003087100F|nr:hypothetical protein U8335_07470 [Stieleria sp. HD01]
MRTENVIRSVTEEKQDGYILLAVIAVLVLLITVLASLSNLSLRRALASREASVRLQQRWGIASIEATVLPRAAKVFERIEEQRVEVKQAGKERTEFREIEFPRQLRSAVTLGEVTFDVLLADEDAKVNLNQVYHMAGIQRTSETLSDLAGPVAAQAIRISPAVDRVPMSEQDLRQTKQDETEPPPLPRAFHSWGTVLDEQRLVTTIGNQAALPNLTSEVTLFGGGAINLKRASDRAIAAVARCVLSRAGADRLVDRYRENPTLSVNLLVDREAKSQSEKTRLKRLLSDSSQHFSLWIDASATARRRQRTFTVTRKDDDGVSVNERFAY